MTNVLQLCVAVVVWFAADEQPLYQINKLLKNTNINALITFHISTSLCKKFVEVMT